MEGVDGGGRGAYKPVWLEFDVFLRSSKTLESSGICGNGEFFGLWAP